jgi:ribosomal protein L25 (general stress protein Ctc)
MSASCARTTPDFSTQVGSQATCLGRQCLSVRLGAVLRGAEPCRFRVFRLAHDERFFETDCRLRRRSERQAARRGRRAGGMPAYSVHPKTESPSAAFRTASSTAVYGTQSTHTGPLPSAVGVQAVPVGMVLRVLTPGHFRPPLGCKQYRWAWRTCCCTLHARCRRDRWRR